MKVDLLFLVFFQFVASVLCERKLFSSGKVRYATSSKITRKSLVDVTEINDELLPKAVHVEFFKINGINDLYRNAVIDMPQLVQLNMINCEILNISPGAFSNIPAISIMKLQDNKLTQVTSGIFNHLNISKLYLNRNSIEHIDKSAFDDMPNLFRIKLNSNYLQVWESDWFKNCPKLTELYVRRNEIQTIPEKAFQNIRGSHPGEDGKLIVDTRIFLSKNSIKTIHPDAMSGLERVEQLWIDRNEIQEIDKKVFANLREISVLNLIKNGIKVMYEDQFPKLENMGVLDLTKNKLTCLPYKTIHIAKVIHLEKNPMNCTCVKELISELEKNRKDHRIVYSKC